MANQPADSYESRLRAVLGVVHRYLPPDGIGAKEALSEITALVDPWPVLASAPIEAAQTSAGYDWKAIAQHYEAALRHIAQSAFASKDWQYARDALASPAAAVRLASAPPAAATVPHVGESKFEAWYSEHDFGGRYRGPAHNKQDMRDAYAAGMSDPLAAATVEVPGYTHADVAAAHAKGYELGLAQKDRPTPAAAAGVPTHAQMMAGYEVACRFGILEARAFDLAEQMGRAMLAASGAPAAEGQQ